MEGTITVKKALNNNVVICASSSGDEAIFIGKGIGFGKKEGDLFDEKTYDKVYSLNSEQERNQYYRLVTSETEETMLLIHEAISKIHDAIGKQLNESTLFALTQHIVLALQRTRDRTEIQNPFLTETKWLYADTYALAEEVVDFIKAETEVTLPEAEIGFITLHIQSTIGHEERPTSDLIEGCIHYAEEKLGRPFDKEAEGFRRFVQHLRQAAEFPLTSPENTTDRKIYLMLKKEHPLCYDISRNVIRMMEKSTGVPAAERDIVQTMLYLMTAASYTYENV